MTARNSEQFKPWAIVPEVLEALRATDTTKLKLDAATHDKLQAATRVREMRPSGGTDAIVQIRGPILPSVGLFEAFFFGAVSAFGLADLFRELAADAQISRVILDVDSPGGGVRGTPEAAAALAELSEAKPTIAVARPRIASAALWIAGQAREVWATPSGEVGGIGVIVEHTSFSGEQGIERTVIADPPRKAELHPAQKLSDDAKDRLKAIVDLWSGKFHAAIAEARGVTAQEAREKFGGGRMLEAEEALEAGLIDKIGEFSAITTPAVQPTENLEDLAAVSSQLRALTSSFGG